MTEPDTSRQAVEQLANGPTFNRHECDCLCIYCECRAFLLALLARCEAAEAQRDEAVKLLRDMCAWFDRLNQYQYEQLVLGQSLESASRNWDMMDGRGFDMGPMQAWLKTFDQKAPPNEQVVQAGNTSQGGDTPS